MNESAQEKAPLGEKQDAASAEVEASAPAADVDPDGTAQDDPTPEGRIAELEAECELLKDRLLRALADAENTRRRAERDRSDAQRYGGVPLARDLLPVHDNLARALAACDDSVRETARELIEGVELTQRELVNAFRKHRIVPINPEKGERFDVNRHQAMFEAPVPGSPDGSIIEVMQDGFMYDDRLLRAAMVGVAKGGGAASPAKGASDATPGDSDGAGSAS